MSDDAPDPAAAYTRAELLQSILVDVTDINLVLENEPARMSSDHLLALAITASNSAAIIRAEAAIKYHASQTIVLSEKHWAAAKKFCSKSEDFEMERARLCSVVDADRVGEGSSNKREPSLAIDAEHQENVRIPVEEEASFPSGTQELALRQVSPPLLRPASDVYEGYVPTNACRDQPPATLQAQHVPTKTSGDQYEEINTPASFIEVHQPTSISLSPSPPVQPMASAATIEKRVADLEEIEIEPAKVVKIEETGKEEALAETFDPVIRIYYQHERADIAIDSADQPDFIEVPQDLAFSHCAMIKQAFRMKRQNEHFDKKDKVCWDAKVSKSKKGFSACKALYIDDLFKRTTKDSSCLKNITDSDRWQSIEIWCDRLLGNEFDLGDYTWKFEKGRTLLIGKWMGFSRTFMDELRLYEGEQHELMPED
ncbi:hypothetical protein BKA65DRAFT_559901 [Rhexocercosporidium sp. MPI-PUGE-AT-0058]|nr:hypothetical protein BKA65DRAFT_559901 [Rhexocercosporidium sp. MPI-PUGE-AT-0058]